jgi:hypothetical protein
MKRAIQAVLFLGALFFSARISSACDPSQPCVYGIYSSTYAIAQATGVIRQVQLDTNGYLYVNVGAGAFTLTPSTYTAITSIIASSTTNSSLSYQGGTWTNSVTGSSTTLGAACYQAGSWGSSSYLSSGTITNITQTVNVVSTGTAIVGATTGGSTYFHIISTAGANGYVAVTKVSAGTLYSFCCVNTGTTLAYAKPVDKATNPTIGTDTPALSYGVPANLSTGSGICPHLPPQGIAFANGIAWMITGGAADSDNTAVALNQVICSGSYQ